MVSLKPLSALSLLPIAVRVIILKLRSNPVTSLLKVLQSAHPESELGSPDRGFIGLSRPHSPFALSAPLMLALSLEAYHALLPNIFKKQLAPSLRLDLCSNTTSFERRPLISLSKKVISCLPILLTASFSFKILITCLFVVCFLRLACNSREDGDQCRTLPFPTNSRRVKGMNGLRPQGP